MIFLAPVSGMFASKFQRQRIIVPVALSIFSFRMVLMTQA